MHEVIKQYALDCCYQGESIMVAMFLNNGISLFKSDSRQEAHLPTKGDLKPTSYLCSTQKTLITAKKAQMRMVGLEIQHYVTTASNLQNKLKRNKATLKNPQINQACSLYLRLYFKSISKEKDIAMRLQQKVDKSPGRI